MATGVDLSKYKRIVQYFWDPEPTNDAASIIWCLGQAYRIDPASPDLVIATNKPETTPDEVAETTGTPQALHEGEQSTSTAKNTDNGWPSAFLDDFEARLWFTYRSSLPPITKSTDPKAKSTMSIRVRIASQLSDPEGFTSDTGWGCMIRSGQSLLGNALLSLRLGRGWRRGDALAEEQKLLMMFADDPKAPFSIHRFVEHGAQGCGKHPGQWFGPSATAFCIKALMHEEAPQEMKVYVIGDGADVHEETFREIAMGGGTTFVPTLILIGTRLGLDKVTPVYWEALKATLQMPQSIGIAGGRPSSSHYFVATQGPYLFYLDPHQTQTALALVTSPESLTKAAMDTCHTRRLRRIHVKEMDPSMLLAFLIRDEDDWKRWRKGVLEVQGKSVVRIADKDPSLHGMGTERHDAIDEVESFDEADDDFDHGQTSSG